MKINSPILFGIAGKDLANKILNPLDVEVEGQCPCLFKADPEIDFMRALVGYRSLTIVAHVSLEEQDTYEDAVKAYLPRSIRGVFDGIAFLLCADSIVVVELYRKDPVE